VRPERRIGKDLDPKKLATDFVNTIKDRLNLGPKIITGVDIGLSAVKVAELDESSAGQFKLVKFASVALPEGALIEDEIQKEEEIAEVLKEALEKAGTSSEVACLGLSGPNTVARRLQLAGGTYEEVEDQVTWEAEQYLPFALEESSLAFHIVGENEGGGVDVIVAATKNDTMNAFKTVVETASLRVKIVDLGVLALTNVFELIMGDKLEDPGQSWLIIDLGAQKTEFIIYKNNMIVFTKEMNIGGVMITEEIQRQMGVNYFEAEDLKINGDENGNLPEEILEIIDDVVEAFFSEIKKTIDFYVSSTSDESLASCMITGGGALIPGLMEGLEALLGVDVSVLNPFDAFEYDEKAFSEEEINEVTYKGVVALGLALRRTGNK
jgi:type IV pilus assembly protein PilM